MKFIFKMLVLVGMILVGKFLKESTTAEISKKENSPTEDIYSMNLQERIPFTHQTKSTEVTIRKGENTAETATYSLN
ncbi:hypothetical protein [Rufibacter latericius]|uniref:Uncharacterized protein n=1 Tax=Rufibacter latericius TaxID=2487040 RepID=A0A3M9ME62_9BACT|nr:hypothetical protein [Rufibacter latericius]RNI23427.1 hypothetical protein EFB08_17965 [Rufibacter latericius]